MSYTEFSIEEIKNWLKDNLNQERYLHSIGTMEKAHQLAKEFSLDEEKAKIAGLLHDCAKCLPNDTLLDIIQNKYKSYEPCELLNPKTWHAPASAYIANTQFKINDGEILSAIRWHTLGRVGMSDFEKIIYLADKIEEKTREDECRSKICKVLYKHDNLDRALLKCFKITIKSLMKRKLPICHQAIDVYNDLLTRIS